MLYTIPDVLFVAQGDVTIFNVRPPVVSVRHVRKMDGRVSFYGRTALSLVVDVTATLLVSPFKCGAPQEC